MKLRYHGFVAKDGRMSLYNRNGFVTEVGKHFKDCEVTVTVEKRQTERTVQQNRYYWGVIIPLIRNALRDAGYRATKDTAHRVIKHLFVQEELVNEQTGELITFTGATSALSKEEFMVLIERIHQWAAEEFGLNIPDPYEQTEIEFN
jgi:hypothetical protein